MKNTLKKILGIALAAIMLMQATAFASDVPKNLRWVTGMDLDWNVPDDKFIAWDFVSGCDAYVIYVYKDNVLVDTWLIESDFSYYGFAFEDISVSMEDNGAGSYTVKVSAYMGDPDDYGTYDDDADDPNITAAGTSEMSAPYNYAGGTSSQNQDNAQISAPSEPVKEPSKEEPSTGKRTAFDYAENAEIECPLAVKVCYDLGILPNVYDDAKRFVTYDEFNAIWKNFFAAKFDSVSYYEPKAEENIYMSTMLNIAMYRLWTRWDGIIGDHRIFDGLAYGEFTEVTYPQLAKIIYNLLGCDAFEVQRYDTSTGSKVIVPEGDGAIPNGLLFKLGYEKYLGDVTVSGNTASFTGKHYTHDAPIGKAVSDVSLAIADDGLKSDAKNMVLFVKDGEIVSAVSYDAAKAEKITHDYTLPYTLNLKIGSTDTSVRDYHFATDAAPMIASGRTMLPIRLVAERLGAEVKWHQSLNTVIITKGKKQIEIVIGADSATVRETHPDGEEMAPRSLPLDSPAFIENGRTYLPVRFVAENLGASVSWDADTQTVTISRQNDAKGN